MDLTTMFTDDQLGILGCFVALSACGLMAAVTFHTGPAGRKSLNDSETPRTIPATKRTVSELPSEERRAA